MGRKISVEWQERRQKTCKQSIFFPMTVVWQYQDHRSSGSKRADAETFKEWSHRAPIMKSITWLHAYFSLQQPARRKFSLRRGPPLNVHCHLYSVAYYPVHASQLICLAFKTLFLSTSIFQETWLRPDGKTAPSSFLYFSLLITE